MTRPPALHVGSGVILPTGETVAVTARQAGPITRWKAGGAWWHESELRLPDEPTPAGISPLCRDGHHDRCGTGWVENGVPHACTCICGHPEREPGRPATGVDVPAFSDRPKRRTATEARDRLLGDWRAALDRMILRDPATGEWVTRARVEARAREEAA